VIKEQPEQLEQVASQVPPDSKEPPGYVVPVEQAEKMELRESREALALKVSEARLAQLERREHRAFQDQQARQVLRERQAPQRRPSSSVRQGQR
jgi:hypothetical protein